ncbi:MAG: FHA domain-containing protein [Acidimicrobiia bacterium]
MNADPEPLEEHDPTVAYEPETAAGAEAATERVAGVFRFALVVERGPRAGLTHVLGEGITTAGRAEESDIFLGDVTVSRYHTRFVVDDTGLTMEDLGSTNGTYVNMERRDSATLAPGDEVIIGRFHLIVVEGDV